jgi:dTMP kinase
MTAILSCSRVAAMRGRLITIEGIDGAGKTTLAAGLLEVLTARGVAVQLLREPGGAALSERLREVVKDPSLTVDPRAEALVYAAARAQLVHERLIPLLDGGTWVLLDRFVDSSLAYQGGGRRLGVDEIAELNRFATAGLVPDRTLYLRVDPQLGRARQGVRAQAADRLEQEDDTFFGAVALVYEDLAALQPERIRAIDAAQDPSTVLADAIGAISDLLG